MTTHFGPTSNRRRWSALVLAAALLLAAPASADKSAAALVREAMKNFENKEYALAAEKLTSAYALAPTPELLFARAQAERLAERCDRAEPLYREFLAGKPTAADATAAQRGLDSCAEAAGSEGGATLKQTDPVPEPSDGTSPATSPRPSLPLAEPTPQIETDGSARPWYRDPWGGGLVLLGGASVVGAAGYWRSASKDKDRLSDQNVDYAEFNRIADRVERKRTTAAALAAGGAALLVAGIVRYAMVGGDEDSTERGPVVTFGDPAAGVGLSVLGQF